MTSVIGCNKDVIIFTIAFTIEINGFIPEITDKAIPSGPNIATNLPPVVLKKSPIALVFCFCSPAFALVVTAPVSKSCFV